MSLAGRPTTALGVEHESASRSVAGHAPVLDPPKLALRWCAAGMVGAGKPLRRVNGHLHLPALRAAVEREVTEAVGPLVRDDLVNVA